MIAWFCREVKVREDRGVERREGRRPEMGEGRRDRRVGSAEDGVEEDEVEGGREGALDWRCWCFA